MTNGDEEVPSGDPVSVIETLGAYVADTGRGLGGVVALVAGACVGLLFAPWLSNNPFQQVGTSSDAFASGYTHLWPILIIVAAAIAAAGGLVFAVNTSPAAARVAVVGTSLIVAFTLAEYAYLQGVDAQPSVAVDRLGETPAVHVTLGAGASLTMIAAVIALFCAMAIAVRSSARAYGGLRPLPDATSE